MARLRRLASRQRRSRTMIEACAPLATTGIRHSPAWLLSARRQRATRTRQASSAGFLEPAAHVRGTAWQVSGGSRSAGGGRPLWPCPWRSGFWAGQVRHERSRSERLSAADQLLTRDRDRDQSAQLLHPGCGVFIDGTETLTAPVSGRTRQARRWQPHQVLFAWRWQQPGRRTVTIGRYPRHHGGPFFAMNGYLLVR
jgi:hypothetical protein